MLISNSNKCLQSHYFYLSFHSWFDLLNNNLASLAHSICCRQQFRKTALIIFHFFRHQLAQATRRNVSMIVSVYLTSFRIHYRLIAEHVDDNDDLNITFLWRSNIVASRNLSICIVDVSWNRDADSNQERAVEVREQCDNDEHVVYVFDDFAGLKREVKMNIQVWKDDEAWNIIED